MGDPLLLLLFMELQSCCCTMEDTAGAVAPPRVAFRIRGGDNGRPLLLLTDMYLLLLLPRMRLLLL